jgi:predicted  nucleic acid-binding Zn-ribbon protein
MQQSNKTPSTVRTDITITVTEWLGGSFVGQVVLWAYGHIKEPHFITAFTLWAVKAAARVLEPLLLCCSAYLMVSAGVPSLLNPDMHDFSMSVLMGAPDVILPGGFVTVWQKFAKKQPIAGSILVLLLVTLATLTIIANAEVFGVVHMDEASIKQLLFWRAMLGTAYSTTIIITLLAAHSTQKERTLSAIQIELEISREEAEGLSTELETAQQTVSSLRVQLGSRQQEVERLQVALEASQQRLGTLQEERDGGQNETAALQRKLNAALVETDTVRAQLEGKNREIAGLQEMIENGQEWQESRVQQMLVAEQRRVASLQEQLEGERTAITTLQRQLHTANLQITDLSAKLEAANGQITHLQNAVKETASVTAKLQEKEREFAVIQANLQSAKSQIVELQKVKVQMVQPAKSRMVKPANADNITSIETAKQSRMSHAEVLAYMAANPSLKRAEVAANLLISERKVYDAVAWGKEQNDENAVAH